MDSFSRELGTQQGRIRPAGWTPAEGEYVCCLGFDRAGTIARLSLGDRTGIVQTADFGDALVASVTARLRCPKLPFLMPPVRWHFKILVDGTARVDRVLRDDRTWDALGISFCVADLAAGDHSLEFRLEVGS